jgi:hypothetical protein
VERVTVASSVFAFHAFNLMWLGLLAGLIAVRLNWYNVLAGYWLNVALVGFTDLGLLGMRETAGLRASHSALRPANV